MATIHGTCGSTKAVRKLLDRQSIAIDRLMRLPVLRDQVCKELEDIEDSLPALWTERLAAYEGMVAHHAGRCAAIETANAELVGQHQAALAAVDVVFNQQLGEMKAAAQLLPPFPKRLLMPRVLLRGARMFLKRMNHVRMHETARAKVNEPLLQVVPRPPVRPSEADHRAGLCDPVQAKLGSLAEILLAPEYAGATAEEDVAHHLSGLPDGYHVLHDVSLSAGEWLFHNGKNIKTAQIDHVVVGPTGIYVIETKRWSRQFAENGGSQSPYDQVCNASQICYHVLGRDLSVREMVVTMGALPPRPPSFKGGVTDPRKACHWIQNGRMLLTPDQVQRAVRILKQFN